MAWSFKYFIGPLSVRVGSSFGIGRRNRAESETEKMIYRKWSLLSGPAVIGGGVVAAVVVANFIVFGDPFRKPEQRKPDTLPSTK